jgi:hypothetical protein
VFELMQTRYGLGIDIGGSSAKLGVVSSEGQILHRAVAPMGRFLEAGEMIESLARSVRELLNWAEKASVGLAGIGIGHPGFYDEQGHLRDLCNLPALNGLNLAGLFQERFGLPGCRSLPIFDAWHRRGSGGRNQWQLDAHNPELSRRSGACDRRFSRSGLHLRRTGLPGGRGVWLGHHPAGRGTHWQWKGHALVAGKTSNRHRYAN